jgi:hypothetical protein
MSTDLNHNELRQLELVRNPRSEKRANQPERS